MNETRLDPAKAFLGVGWAFPPDIAADGKIAEAVYEDDIKQAIRIIMFTNPGERLMRPDFGAGLERFVFEPISTTTMSSIETQVYQALNLWEPRIDVLEVAVETDQSERNKVLIEVSYRIRASNSVHNLVYPLYLQEGTSR
jgi:phage baseplate assembly protein W